MFRLVNVVPNSDRIASYSNAIQFIWSTNEPIAAVARSYRERPNKYY